MEDCWHFNLTLLCLFCFDVTISMICATIKNVLCSLLQWRSLDMSGVERRRLFCAVLFHVAAALCVIWSLCVLIERAADEVKRGQIGWPFWTKLVVVTVGLTGGIVFMYIQCKQYLNLCTRWRARNR